MFKFGEKCVHVAVCKLIKIVVGTDRKSHLGQAAVATEAAPYHRMGE